jgi:DNA-directed RNA polymerase
MTSVYGVTAIGARDQIEARLKERTDLNFDDPTLNVRPEQNRSRTAGYLAQTTLQSLGTLFKSAQNIMDWLRTCASIITSRGAVVSWTTPLGLPVVQPYLKSELYPVCRCQSVIVGLEMRYLARLLPDPPTDTCVACLPLFLSYG